MKPTPKSLWLSISTALSVAYLAYAESPQSTGQAQSYTTQSSTESKHSTLEIRQAGDNTSYIGGAWSVAAPQAMADFGTETSAALRISPPSRQGDRMRAPSRAKNIVQFRKVADSSVTMVPQNSVSVSAVAYKLVSRRGLILQPEAVEAFDTVQRDPDAQSIREKLGDFTVTAYALTATSTGKSPGQPGFGITASGSRASVGRTVAVDPLVIPIGSLVYIDLPGIGWRLAEDTGGAIKGRHIDLLLPSDSAAIQFGVKHSVPVYTMSR